MMMNTVFFFTKMMNIVVFGFRMMIFLHIFFMIKKFDEIFRNVNFISNWSSIRRR